MEENVRKVRKSRISTGRRGAVKRGRIHRFARWCEETYGTPWRSMYEKLRHGRVKAWEGAGIIRCMDEYGFHGNPGDLWNKCKRNGFCEFMETRQMSRMTVWKRFGANDFNALEMEGIVSTYRNWRMNIDLAGK